MSNPSEVLTSPTPAEADLILAWRRLPPDPPEFGVKPTAEQAVRRLLDGGVTDMVARVDRLQATLDLANDCFVRDHEGQIRMLQAALNRATR